jgi:hypothetical protein
MDGSVYVASQSPLRLDPERLPFTVEETLRRLTADRAFILASTAQARLNRDFAPNSEYYLTYPYAATLQTRFANPLAYAARNPEELRRLIGHSPVTEADPAVRRVASGSWAAAIERRTGN